MPGVTSGTFTAFLTDDADFLGRPPRRPLPPSGQARQAVRPAPDGAENSNFPSIVFIHAGQDGDGEDDGPCRTNLFCQGLGCLDRFFPHLKAAQGVKIEHGDLVPRLASPLPWRRCGNVVKLQVEEDFLLLLKDHVDDLGLHG